MKSKILGLLAVGLLAGPVAANAVQIAIDATTANGSVTSFSLVYDDVSGDGMLQLSELVSFSGFTLSGIGTIDGFYSQVIGTPDISGISTSTGVVIGAPGLNWNFLKTDNSGACCYLAFWTYSERVVGVPEPGTLALLGLGLAGLGLSRRRKTH